LNVYVAAGSGDSGGPAICRDNEGYPVLCGITSWGYPDEPCINDPNEETCTPSLYTDVSHFREWIIENGGMKPQ